MSIVEQQMQLDDETTALQLWWILGIHCPSKPYFVPALIIPLIAKSSPSERLLVRQEAIHCTCSYQKLRIKYGRVCG